MRPPLIRQSPTTSPSAADDTAFSWARVAEELGMTPDGPVNIAELAVDRHARSAHAGRTAFRFLNADGSRRDLSYRELAGLTDRFGNALATLGVRKGDRVFVLCGRICEL